MLKLKKIFRCLTQVACLLLLGSMYLAEIIVPSLTLLQKDGIHRNETKSPLFPSIEQSFFLHTRPLS